jgi:glutamate racemase
VQQAIAILDSGVGGLTVVKEVMRQLPQERIIYFGDTSRAPYGPRPAEEVRLFTEQIVDFLIQFRPKMIVIACNTATAVAIEDIRSRLSIPVVGVIYPGARAAIKKTKCGLVGVIGTEGTIRSRAYDRALKRISPTIQLVSKACPEFVPLVENGSFDTAETREIVRQSLEPLMSVPMDCLILGCTHYPFLSPVISEIMGPKVQLINSAEETAREISAILQHRGMLAKNAANPLHQFFCSGSPQLFQKIAQQWLNQPVKVTPVFWERSRLANE